MLALVLLTAADRARAQDAPSPVAAWSADFDNPLASLGTAGDVNGDGVDDLIVGEPVWQDPSDPRGSLGRAYVFLGHCGDVPSLAPDWFAQGSSWFDDHQLFAWQGTYMGEQVGSAGDVNGDGFGDVFVHEAGWTESEGDPSHPSCDPSDGQCPHGRVHVWYGTAAGLPGAGTGAPAPAADWTWHGDNPLDVELQVASAGDVNGDGYDDLVIGSPYCCRGDAPLDVRGRVRLFHGSATGLGPSPATVLDETAPLSFFGFGAGAGDVNGDGFGDLLVGDPGYTPGAAPPWSVGRAALFAGSASGVQGEPSWWVTGDVEWGDFGQEVAGLGDVNGDGKADLAVTQRVGSKLTRVYLGAATWPEQVPHATLPMPRWGHRPAGPAGDVNADGFADVVVSHEWDEAARVHRGSATGLGATTTLQEPQEDAGALAYGSPAWTAGDVNGDGASDVLVAQEAWDDACESTCRGRAWLYLGVGPEMAAPESPCACRASVADVTFEPPFVTLDDDYGDRYPVPHWTADEACRSPVAISRAALPRISVTFSIEPARTVPTEAIIEGRGPDGLHFGATQTFAGGTLMVTNIPAATTFSNHVATHSPAAIAWTVTLADACGSVPLAAGVTENRLHVMFGEPDPAMPKRHESVFDIACRGVTAGGTDVNVLVDQVYANFETPGDGVKRKESDGCGKPDGVVMKYWAEAGSALEAAMNDDATTGKASGMLNPEPARGALNGRGRCGAWQQLLSWCLRAHGIPWAPRPADLVARADTIYSVTVLPAYTGSLDGSEGILVRQWMFGPFPSGPPPCVAEPYMPLDLPVRGPAQPFPFVAASPTACGALPPATGEVCDAPGIGGQGGPDLSNPSSFFNNHALVFVNGRLFDPSYGSAAVDFPQTPAEIEAWETENLSGFTTRCAGWLRIKPNDPSLPETLFNIELVE